MSNRMTSRRGVPVEKVARWAQLLAQLEFRAKRYRLAFLITLGILAVENGLALGLWVAWMYVYGR